MDSNHVKLTGAHGSQITTPLMISKLWVFLSLNYILCDLLTNMESSVLRGLIDGNIAGIIMSQKFLLMAGISLEIPFIMVLLSVVIPYQASRILNIIAGALMILYQLASFFIGSELTIHYIFFSVIEMLGNSAVIILAYKWKKE